MSLETPEKLEYTVEKPKQRLDAFLAEKAEISRVKAKKCIEAEQCLVNNAKASADYKLKRDDIVSYMPIIESTHLEAEDGELDILYQDNDYVIINKPPNLTVHPAASQEKGTLVHILLKHFPSLAQMEGERPGIVHRIDKDTSGILAIALHEKARLALAKLFSDRQIHKEYLALVHNVPLNEQVIELNIGRHESNKTKMAVKKNGKYALTEFQLVHSDTERNYALLAVRIHTGRTHQIRVHLSHVGYPLWGDKVYTGKLSKPLPKALEKLAQRQMLHAYKLQFIQPLTNENIDIVCPIPEDMEYCLKKLKTKTKKFIITGNMGTGKSSVLTIYKELGYPTFSADACVQELYKKGNAGAFLLQRVFGDEALAEDGSVNKKYLLELMKNEQARIKLENIIHPLVDNAMNAFFAECEEKVEQYAFAEIPLYLEGGESSIKQDRKKYKVITVWAKEEIRLERLRARHWNDELIYFLDSLQLSVEEKKAQADILIENSTSLEELKARCMAVVEE